MAALSTYVLVHFAPACHTALGQRPCKGGCRRWRRGDAGGLRSSSPLQRARGQAHGQQGPFCRARPRRSAAAVDQVRRPDAHAGTRPPAPRPCCPPWHLNSPSPLSTEIPGTRRWRCASWSFLSNWAPLHRRPCSRCGALQLVQTLECASAMDTGPNEQDNPSVTLTWKTTGKPWESIYF